MQNTLTHANTGRIGICGNGVNPFKTSEFIAHIQEAYAEEIAMFQQFVYAQDAFHDENTDHATLMKKRKAAYTAGLRQFIRPCRMIHTLSSQVIVRKPRLVKKIIR